jgi:four helix bundle protein
MAVQSFRDLIAWQKAMDLVVLVYRATEGFPSREMFGIVNQMRRAAVSVPSNIAEGQGRLGSKEFCRFLGIARGSVQELQTQVLIARRLEFLTEEQSAELIGLATEVARIVNGLLSSLTTND